ncbi:hypothetical protein E2P81_ATG11981 [Venturia nashicola]|uniref:Uncharacterized protein n=1 Tax=Venturia nashicola TaxID=86259 RepID=A0A4Z1NPL3_9PEZI|nr:hypothetical protein E6O75_ATG11676 [Venturia nashicola]TLD24645.1 hypothetical protein E2P81_ATG11981 [Venturia nashicola]
MSNAPNHPIWIFPSSPQSKPRNGCLNNPISINSSSPLPIPTKTEPKPSILGETNTLPSSPPLPTIKTEPKPSSLRETNTLPSSPPPPTITTEPPETQGTPPESMEGSFSRSSQPIEHIGGRTLRESKSIPYRLRQNTSVYLDDKSFIDGFTFLTNVVAAGTSVKDPPPAFTPSTSVLALCATLIVHPTYTTRAKTDEDVRASNEALRFLRNVNEIVGPINAHLKTAFTFETSVKKRRRLERGSKSPITPDSASEKDIQMQEDNINSPFAHEKSVFTQVEDFWQVVGWAFNCSIAYRKRWDRWKCWLDIMLDVLGKDLEQNIQQAKPQASLINQYMKGKNNRTAWREVMAAILADGSHTSMKKFGEVWQNETRERKAKENESIQEINIEEGNFGDYDAIDDDDEIMEEGEQDQPVEAPAVDEHLEDWGGPESIALRQRFLQLLIWHVWHSRVLDNAFPDLETLFDIITECLRPLPLTIFSQFISTSLLETNDQCCLLTNLMIPFLPRAPANLDVFRPEQDKFVKHFLPCAANSTRVSENLKMSLMIEALLMNMWTAETLQPGKALTDAVKKGVKARSKRCEYSTRTKEDKEHQTLLVMSAERINLILEMLEMPNDPAMSIGGLDGTDESPSSTLSDLSDLDSDMTDPNDDTTMTLGHVDRSSSTNSTPESSEESVVSKRSVSPDSKKKAREWDAKGARKRKVLNSNVNTRWRRRGA